jgi:hypothetical protein
VQYILDLGLAWAVAEVIDRLDGNFVHLAMQKFSSNVVEKCLKLGGEESRAKIIQELTGSTRLAQLLQDPFANYVVQSALTISKVIYSILDLYVFFHIFQMALPSACLLSGRIFKRKIVTQLWIISDVPVSALGNC